MCRLCRVKSELLFWSDRNLSKYFLGTTKYTNPMDKEEGNWDKLISIKMYHFGFEEVIHSITSQNVWEENNSLQEKKEGNVGWCPRIWAREAGACSTTGPRESAPRLVGNQPHILLTSSSSPSSPSRSSGPSSRSLSPSQSSGRSPWDKLPILAQIFLADVGQERRDILLIGHSSTTFYHRQVI